MQNIVQRQFPVQQIATTYCIRSSELVSSVVVGYVQVVVCSDCYQWHFAAYNDCWSELATTELGLDSLEEALSCVLMHYHKSTKEVCSAA